MSIQCFLDPPCRSAGNLRFGSRRVEESLEENRIWTGWKPLQRDGEHIRRQSLIAHQFHNWNPGSLRNSSRCNCRSRLRNVPCERRAWKDTRPHLGQAHNIWIKEQNKNKHPANFLQSISFLTKVCGPEFVLKMSKIKTKKTWNCLKSQVKILLSTSQVTFTVTDKWANAACYIDVKS